MSIWKEDCEMERTCFKKMLLPKVKVKNRLKVHSFHMHHDRLISFSPWIKRLWNQVREIIFRMLFYRFDMEILKFVAVGKRFGLLNSTADTNALWSQWLCIHSMRSDFSLHFEDARPMNFCLELEWKNRKPLDLWHRIQWKFITMQRLQYRYQPNFNYFRFASTTRASQKSPNTLHFNRRSLSNAM